MADESNWQNHAESKQREAVSEEVNEDSEEWDPDSDKEVWEV